MAEKVETGGLMSFDYNGKDGEELSEDRKRGIEEGYKKFEERTAREKKTRVIKWTIVGVVLVLIALAIYFMVR